MNLGKAIIISFGIAATVGYCTTKSCTPETISYWTGAETEKVAEYQNKGRELGSAAKDWGSSISDIVKSAETKPEEKTETIPGEKPEYSPQALNDLQQMLEAYERLKKNSYSQGPE